MPKKQFTGRCEPEVLEKLRKIAKKRRVSLSWVMQDAFMKYLENKDE